MIDVRELVKDQKDVSKRLLLKRTRMVIIIRVTACRLGATMFSCGVDQWLPPNVNRFGGLLGEIICNPPDLSSN